MEEQAHIETKRRRRSVGIGASLRFRGAEGPWAQPRQPQPHPPLLPFSELPVRKTGMET